MDVIRIKLFGENASEPDIPYWWVKFARGCGYNDFSTIEEVNECLMDWSANFWIAKHTDDVRDLGDRYIDFYDEHAYTWFMLRWK